MFLTYFVKELKSRSKLICISTLLFLAAGTIAGLNSEEKWSSESILIEPRFHQVSSFFLIMESLSNFDVKTDKGIDPKFIFDRFITEASTIDNKRRYLQSIGMKMTEAEADDTIRVFLNPDKDLIKISFISSSALQAKQGLEKYLAYINRNVNESFVDYLKDVKKIASKKLRIKLDISRKAAKYQFYNEKKKLEVSRKITNSAGQIKPIHDPGVRLSLPVTLGYDLINSHIRELKDNDYEVFMKNFNNKSKLDYLVSIEPEKLEIQPFFFKKSPDVPSNKISPSLIKNIIFSLLCSLLFSIVIAMFGIRENVIEDSE